MVTIQLVLISILQVSSGDVKVHLVGGDNAAAGNRAAVAAVVYLVDLAERCVVMEA